jgi:hypothetical protein
MKDDMAVELATVGNEGMVGLPVFLGSGTIPLTSLCQGNRTAGV